MAVTAMLGLRSTLATLSCGDGISRVRGGSFSDSVDRPVLRGVPNKRAMFRKPCELRSEILPGFLVSIPSSQSRRRRLHGAGAGKGGALTSTSFASDAEQLRQAREELKIVLSEKKSHPIFIRMGWHDSGSYDKNIADWPKRGGANGSLRFSPELAHGANAGLIKALEILEPVKAKFPDVSYADFFQLASATAIEHAGGPKIPMKYGRVDTANEAECAIEGNLPDGAPPDPAGHLRQVFYRMGLNDKEIVALSGAHTIGRSRPERSGFGKSETKYTNRNDKDMGARGGQSWTVDWLTFDNSYFKDIIAQSDEDLLVLPTDKILVNDPEFKVYTEKYAQDQDAFFKDYAEAHAKLSELGSKWDPPEGFSIDVAAPTPEKFVAANYSSDTKRELSSTMKDKMRAEYLAVGGSPDKPLKSNYFLNIIIAIAVLAVLSSLVTQN